MAWPKLRNKSSGPLMTASDRSGAAHDGARSHGGAPQGASGGSARGPAEPVPDALAAWPGPVEDEAAPAEVVPAEVGGEAEPESADLPLWDWSPPGESVPDDLADEPAAQQADPPRSEWKLVVTPVEEVNGATGTQPPGIGQRRGNLTHLASEPEDAGLAAAGRGRGRHHGGVLHPGLLAVRAHARGDRRHRRHHLPVPAELFRHGADDPRAAADPQATGQAGAGGLPRHARQHHPRERGPDRPPGGRAGGVFAIDSEAWDKHMPVRTSSHKQLWLGPENKKDRLEHARWEAERAADLLSGAIGKSIAVRPVMAVYGPKILWDVATIGRSTSSAARGCVSTCGAGPGRAGMRPLTDERGRADLPGREPGVPASQLGFAGELIRALSPGRLVLLL